MAKNLPVKLRPKKKTGRKPVVLPDFGYVEKLAEEGMMMKDIAALSDIGQSTMYEHMSKNKEFAEAIARGKAKRKQKLVEKFYKMIDDDNTLGHVKADLMKFELERRHGFANIEEQQEKKPDITFNIISVNEAPEEIQKQLRKEQRNDYVDIRHSQADEEED